MLTLKNFPELISNMVLIWFLIIYISVSFCVVHFDRTQFGSSPMNLYYYFLRKSFTTTFNLSVISSICGLYFISYCFIFLVLLLHKYLFDYAFEAVCFLGCYGNMYLRAHIVWNIFFLFKLLCFFYAFARQINISLLSESLLETKTK